MTHFKNILLTSLIFVATICLSNTASAEEQFCPEASEIKHVVIYHTHQVTFGVLFEKEFRVYGYTTVEPMRWFEMFVKAKNHADAKEKAKQLLQDVKGPIGKKCVYMAKDGTSVRVD